MKYNKIINDNYTTIEVISEDFSVQDANTLIEILDEFILTNQNIIINLRQVENMNTEACHLFENIHDSFYQNGHSLVFAEPSQNVHNKIKQEQLHLIINICPTQEEAIDIISMESLERELLNE